MKTLKNERHLYEDAQRWDKLTLSGYIREKIELIKELIPSGVVSIADLGCGNGVVTNSLPDRCWIVGMDRSWAALQSVEAIRVSGSIESLPFTDKAFDFILVSEVLEHLPQHDLARAVDEMKRICGKYLLITVPNREYLSKNHLKCPECGHIFNAAYHLHSFDKEKIVSFFPDYRLLTSFECGKRVRQYSPFLLKIKQKLGRSWTRIAENRPYICPQCHHRFEHAEELNVVALLCNMINRILIKPKPYWLGVLLERKEIERKI